MRKGLLLGAGFSYDLGMPLAAELTEMFLSLFNEQRGRQLADVLSLASPYGKDRPINKAALHEGVGLLLDYKQRKGNNYEELLSNLQSLGDLPGKSQSERDSFHYLFAIFYDLIYKILALYQCRSYEILYHVNMPAFAKWDGLLSAEETWIFSLNHDLYVECLAIDLGIPITYGDVGELSFPVSNLDMSNKIHFSCSSRNEFNKNALGWINKKKGINLVRLHGGLAEYEYSDKTLLCNPSLKWVDSSGLISEFKKIETMAHYHLGRNATGKDKVITGPDGQLDIITRAMLTGGKKYSSTTNAKKGEEKLKLLDDVLKELDELTVIGYSFGDKHINDRILNSMVLNPNLKIWIVDPAVRRWPEFLFQFDYDMRLRRAYIGAAQWMTRIADEKWDPVQLKDSATYRAEIRKKVEASLPASV